MKFFTANRTGRLLTIASFVVVSALIFAFMLSGTQIHVPVLNEARPYHVSVLLKDTDNLVPAGDVRIAGVHVGEVQSIENEPAGANAKIRLDQDVAPLHKGVTVRVGEKSVVGETYLEVVDGEGAPLPIGAQLPKDAVQPSTQLHDLLSSLDKPTRESLGRMIRSLGAGTDGTRADFATIVAGLGKLGRNGHTALDAVAAQSQDLRALARETTTVLAALDTGEGQIAQLVSNARKITSSVSGQREAVKESMRQFPATLASTRRASGALTELAGTLAPVASDLKRAGPDLRAALNELPGTTGSIRSMLPTLDVTLRRAPATLDRLPRFSEDVRAFIPAARTVLADVNPMLSYLMPYGPDIAAWISNFNSVLKYTDGAGVHYARMQPLINEAAGQSPVKAPVKIQHNPYPAPGQGGFPGRFNGNYPRLERAPR